MVLGTEREADPMSLLPPHTDCLHSDPLHLPPPIRVLLLLKWITTNFNSLKQHTSPHSSGGQSPVSLTGKNQGVNRTAFLMKPSGRVRLLNLIYLLEVCVLWLMAPSSLLQASNGQLPHSDFVSFSTSLPPPFSPFKDPGLPWWLSGKESGCQCRRRGFDPWVGKIPWRRAWQPTPVFLPGESHGQRSLGKGGGVSHSAWSCKESDRTEWISLTHFSVSLNSLHPFQTACFLSEPSLINSLQDSIWSLGIIV